MRDREIRQAIQEKVALFVNTSVLFEGRKGKTRVRLMCGDREEHVYYGMHVGGREFANKLGDVTRALNKLSIPRRKKDEKKAVVGIGTLGEKIMEAVGLAAPLTPPEDVFVPPQERDLGEPADEPRYVATALRLEPPLLPPLPSLAQEPEILCPDAIAGLATTAQSEPNLPKIQGLSRPKVARLCSVLSEVLVSGGFVEVRDLQAVAIARMGYVGRQHILATLQAVTPGADLKTPSHAAARIENVQLSTDVRAELARLRAEDNTKPPPEPIASVEEVQCGPDHKQEIFMQTPNTHSTHSTQSNGARVNGHGASPAKPASPSGIKRQQMSHVMVIGASRLLDKHGTASSANPKDATYTYAEGWSDERVRAEVTPEFSINVIIEFRKNNYGRLEEEIQRAAQNGPYAQLVKENAELRQTVEDLRTTIGDLEARLEACEAVCRQLQ